MLQFTKTSKLWHVQAEDARSAVGFLAVDASTTLPLVEGFLVTDLISG